MPPDSRLVLTVDGSRMVEPGGRRRRRSPSDHRRQINYTLRRILARARERQEAWAEGDRRDITKPATTELERLYWQLRHARRALYETGTPEGLPYDSKTSRVGKGE